MFFNLNICSDTRNVDSMFDQFSEDKKKTLNLLSAINSSPSILQLWDKILSFDKNCLCQMGGFHSLSKKSIGQYPSKKFTCPQCHNMDRLIDMNKDFLEKPFSIECGIETGNKLYITKSPVPYLSLKYKKSTVNLRSEKSNYSDIQNYSYLRCDTFTASILINWILYEEAKSQNLPHVQNLYIAFVCADSGYMLKEYPDAHISRIIADQISKQLIVCLYFLSKYNFCFGYIEEFPFSVFSKPLSYSYKNKEISSSDTLKISNFKWASVDLSISKKIRISADSLFISDDDLMSITTDDQIIFDKEIIDSLISKNNLPDYIISTSEIPTLLTLRKNGLPIFGLSLDCYYLIIYLNSLSPCPTLSSFWQQMWSPSDLSNTDFLLNLKSYDYENVIKNLVGFSLKKDIVNILFKNL